MTAFERATKVYWDIASMEGKPHHDRIQVIAAAIEAAGIQAVEKEREEQKQKLSARARSRDGNA